MESLVLQLAFEDVGEDLHVAVAVRAEALARGDAVVVDHPQRPEVHPLRVVVVGEGEGVIGLEPAVIEESAVGTAAYLQHGVCLVGARALRDSVGARRAAVTGAPREGTDARRARE